MRPTPSLPRCGLAPLHTLTFPQTPFADYKDFVVLPKHEGIPQTVYGVVSVVATQQEAEADGAKTFVLAARTLTRPGQSLTHAPPEVALKVTTLSSVTKLSGTYLDALRDVAGEWKNAAKITKKHGISNRFVNAHDAAFPSWCLLEGRMQTCFAWTMDFCRGGTLNEFLEWQARQEWLDEERRNKTLMPIIFDLLTALKQLHSLHLGHRDLHERNVLFDHEGTLNIGDFGRAKKKVVVPGKPGPLPLLLILTSCSPGPLDALNLTVFGDGNMPPPDSTHPHPATLSTFTDEAYYDPLGVDLWSLGTLISDMLCPPHAQLKWPSDDQVAATKRPKLIQLCVEHRRQQVRKLWTPALKTLLDGRLFDWTLRSFRVETKGVTVTEQDLRFLFPKLQRPPDAEFRAVWAYYYGTQRREKDPFLTPEARFEAQQDRDSLLPHPPHPPGTTKADKGRTRELRGKEEDMEEEDKGGQRERDPAKAVPLKKRRAPPEPLPEPSKKRPRF